MPDQASLPSRERGLKYCLIFNATLNTGVAPFTGARIEMFRWMESVSEYMSLPSRERGLKLV